MKSKEFSLYGQNYKIELYEDNSNEIRIYKYMYRKQKETIIEKLYEIINVNKNNSFSESIIEYVKNYKKGTDRSATQTTRSLGKVLFDYIDN